MRHYFWPCGNVLASHSVLQPQKLPSSRSQDKGWIRHPSAGWIAHTENRLYTVGDPPRADSRLRFSVFSALSPFWCPNGEQRVYKRDTGNEGTDVACILISNRLQNCLLIIATHHLQHIGTLKKASNKVATTKIDLSETYKERKLIVSPQLPYLWDWIVLQCNL